MDTKHIKHDSCSCGYQFCTEGKNEAYLQGKLKQAVIDVIERMRGCCTENVELSSIPIFKYGKAILKTI